MRLAPGARMAALHACVLICSSLIGIVGYYRQHQAFQITACIPASAGLLLLLLAMAPLSSERRRAWLLLAFTFGFGIVVTRLALRFAPQDFQPLRKRVYFPVMALSSWLTCLVIVRAMLQRRAVLPDR